MGGVPCVRHLRIPGSDRALIARRRHVGECDCLRVSRPRTRRYSRMPALRSSVRIGTGTDLSVFRLTFLSTRFARLVSRPVAGRKARRHARFAHMECRHQKTKRSFARAVQEDRIIVSADSDLRPILAAPCCPSQGTIRNETATKGLHLVYFPMHNRGIIYLTYLSVIDWRTCRSCDSRERFWVLILLLGHRSFWIRSPVY